VAELLDAVNRQQSPNRFKGVTTSLNGSQVYVAFPREWDDDPAGLAKIGRYAPATQEWAFYLGKIEGAALLKSGALLVVNDNDGAGETRLLRLHNVISRR
jgi:hypothetical protein